MDPSPLSGKVALVTGGASGIGEATVKLLAGEGASVVALDRDGEGLSRVVREVEEVGAIARAQTLDLSNTASIAAAVAEVIDTEGRIDILVNDAGMACYSRHVDSTLEEWRDTLAINLEAYYVMAKLVAPHMIEKQYGRIVNIASTQALACEPAGHYVASKGGIAAWTRALAVDLAEYGILVNAIAPGCIHTAMSIIDGVDETTTALFKDWYVGRRKIPLARAGAPEEIANIVLFLSGDQCTYICGHLLVADGGLTITF